jgi:serine/threonine protein kinase
MPIKKKLKILLVEDDVIAQIIGQNIIEQAGYNLDVVHSTQKALALLKHKKYDLIFMDLGLPEASGIEFTKELSENLKITTPIIAVTAFNRNSKKEEMRKEEFRKELEIMKKLRHEKLVKLWCVCTIGEPVFIVTEYMCNGSLLKYMREGEGMNLNFKEIIDMAAQVACGMKYLEGSRCVHRDLAARNILVGERNIVKIADFGFAQMLNANDKLELSQDESNKFPGK